MGLFSKWDKSMIDSPRLKRRSWTILRNIVWFPQSKFQGTVVHTVLLISHEFCRTLPSKIELYATPVQEATTARLKTTVLENKTRGREREKQVSNSQAHSCNEWYYRRERTHYFILYDIFQFHSLSNTSQLSTLKEGRLGRAGESCCKKSSREKFEVWDPVFKNLEIPTLR